MLACTALVGCTNSDEPEVNQNQPVSDEYYVTVKFAMSGEGSRALDNYEIGTADETNLTNAVFYFIGSDNNSVADPYELDKNLTLSNADHNHGISNTPGDDKMTNPIIVMKNPTSIPTSIVAILNTKDINGLKDANGKYVKKSLSELTTIASDYDELITTGKFVMSNSVYQNANEEEVIGAPVSKENITTIIKTSETGEKELGESLAGTDVKPVEIHVERVLAKVNVTESSSINNTGTNETLVTDGNAEGVASTIKVEITGWWLDNKYSHSLLLKDLANGPSTWYDASAWNDITNFRSYWANPYSSGTLTPSSTDDTRTSANYEHSAFTENTNDKYCHENTSANNSTKVVVAARLYTGDSYNSTSPVSFVKWRGIMYTLDAFKTAISNLQEVKQYFYLKSGTHGNEDAEYESINSSHLDLAFNPVTGSDLIAGNGSELEDYEAIITLKTGAPQIYTISIVNGAKSAQEVEASAVNTTLKDIATVQYWNGGRTYYYVDIEHDSNKDNAKHAVIRNHLYKLTLNSVTGLGTPVANPDKVIIPERPDDEDVYSYISAQIYVLKYRVVSQGVNLK